MEAGHDASKRKINECGALLRDAPDFTEAIAVVEGFRSAHDAPLVHVSSRIDAPAVSQRLKRLDTIVHKLRRHRRMNLSQMEDIAGARVVLPSQGQVLQLADALANAPHWSLRRKRMYIDGGDPGPKPDGYRAVHLVVAVDGRFVEIQLRTLRQDGWAQTVERDTRQLREGLKFGGGPEDLRDYYRMLSEQFAMFDAAMRPSQAFTAELAGRYAATRRYFPR